MRITHTVRLDADSNPELKKLLKRHGAEQDGEKWHFAEDSHYGVLASALLAGNVAYHGVNTHFSHDDILAAPYSALMPTASVGFPQPEKTYRKRTYEDCCLGCGIWNVQKQPFILKRRRVVGFGFPYWEPGIVFAGGKAAEPLRQHARLLPVWSRAQVEIPDAVQLDVASLPTCELDMPDGYPSTVCSTCGRSKYEHWRRGPLPRAKSWPGAEIAVSAQWFGEGLEAKRLVLLSRNLVKCYLGREASLNAEFWPVGDVSPPPYDLNTRPVMLRP